MSDYGNYPTSPIFDAHENITPKENIPAPELEELRAEIIEDGVPSIPKPEVFEYEHAARYQIIGARNAATAPKSGFDDLDKLISFVPGKTTVLGAETHVGKTTLSANIAANIAFHQKKKVLMFVPESGVEATVIHIACFLNGKTEAELTEDEKRTKIPTLKLVEKSISILDIERIARKEVPDLIIVDHIHYLLKDEKNVTSSIGEAIRGLCELSKKLNTHVIVVAHLKKPDHGRENEIPSIYRLKDSSALYQDPDLVILLHRRRRSVELAQPGEDRLEMEGLIIVEKNRINGKSGIVKFLFDKERHTFLM